MFAGVTNQQTMDGLVFSLSIFMGMTLFVPCSFIHSDLTVERAFFRFEQRLHEFGLLFIFQITVPCGMMASLGMMTMPSRMK